LGGRKETFFCLKEDPTDRCFMSGVMGKRGNRAIRVVTTTKAFLTMLEEAEWDCFTRGDFVCHIDTNGLVGAPCVRYAQ